MKNVSNDIKNAFMGWLASTYTGSFSYGQYTIIRVCKNENFDYLYSQWQYNKDGVERGNKFEYAGFYCKQDGTLYDVPYQMQALSGDKVQSSDALLKRLKQAVCRTVERHINNDRRNLQISELSTTQALGRLASCQSYAASGEARRIYLNDEYNEGKAFAFRCGYTPDAWTEDSLLSYILGPAQYVEAETVAYISSHQEGMLLAFLCADAVAAEYAAILENPLAPIHKVKRIMAAVSASPAKTVTVTICKDDTEFTFKTEAQEFRRDCTSSYSNWNIAAPDRRAFKQRFGRNANYRPEEILCIAYARSVLYQV
jgi:hypothetical protein